MVKNPLLVLESPAALCISRGEKRVYLQGKGPELPQWEFQQGPWSTVIPQMPREGL